MPRRCKPNLGRSSRRAQVAKAKRNQESDDETEMRRAGQAKRQAALRHSETPQQTHIRKCLDAKRHASLRGVETAEQKRARQSIDAHRHAILRADETPEQTQTRRISDSQRNTSRLAKESIEERQKRRVANAKRQASRRANETPEKTRTRKRLDAQRYADRIAAETSEEAQARRSKDAERHLSLRANETLERTQARQQLDAQRYATRRAKESSEQKQRRRLLLAQRYRAQKAAETPEESRRRRDKKAYKQSRRRKAFSDKRWQFFNNAAFNYNPLVNYVDHPLISIGRMDQKCTHCKALKWIEESAGMCCSNGKVSLPLLGEPDEPLKTLLLNETNESQQYLENIRKYNSCFQMTSFGADREVIMPHFSPTFTIQGQVYHLIGSLMPVDNKNHKFLQIYFMQDENNEVDLRCQNNKGVERDTVLKIQRMLHNNNHLIKTFKTALEKMNDINNEIKLVIFPDCVPTNREKLSVSEMNGVAALITGEEFASRDIVLYNRNKTLRRVPDTHKYYDALQYPLIYSRGQPGYHVQIPQQKVPDRTNKGKHLTNKTVSCMNFYAYYMMRRENDFNIILRCRQLTNQFYVDMYVKLESERLKYITLNQSKIRSEQYMHLQDAIANDAYITPKDLGKMVILPSSFVNSPRYLQEYTQDTFTYVREYGCPDLFVTFTCNPKWIEIINELMPGQKATDRHDIIARVFRLKVKKLMSVITEGKIFGKVTCFIYSIEWQQRGLPHVHILIWLKEKLKLNQIDQLIWAEIPDPSIDKGLHEIIINNMIHGPCNQLKGRDLCIKNGRCIKKFPRPFNLETMRNENGYPLYRRRAPADGGQTVEIKMRFYGNLTVDNSWVVPYSPILCKLFNAHINVESCSSLRTIKYICKFIKKDNGQLFFNSGTTKERINEVQTYQTCRYVSSNEAAWRLLGFPLHERHPAVTHLSVHLENGQRIYFNSDNFHDRLANPPDTTLTAFFKLCSTDNFAKTLTYMEVPRYYTWNSKKREWKRRIQGASVVNWPGVKCSDVLGRIYTVPITNIDCFCLRLLLHQVRGPTSFNDLKIHNGQGLLTFRETCEAKGLLENDNFWESTLEEALFCRSPFKMRELLALLIATCGLCNPQELWEKYKQHMANEIQQRKEMNANIEVDHIIHNESLIKIEDHVFTMSGKDLSAFGIDRPVRTREIDNILETELSYDTDALQHHLNEFLPRMNPKQRTVFETIILHIERGNGALFFLDAPAGTGKTFLLNLLLAQIRKDKQVAIAVASTGIASTLLDGGQTAHSVLKIPRNLAHEDKPICNISKNSDRGRLLQQCKLLVWDECTMSHKRAIEALDRTMKDINSNSNIMGGMVVLLAGDFRQILPIVSNGTPADEINASLKASTLWQHVKKLNLTTNMRVYLHNNADAEQYTAALLKIGEGEIETDRNSMIKLGDKLCNIVNTTEELIEKVYPHLINNACSVDWLCERAILAPSNEIVAEVNEKIMADIKEECTEYLAIDSVMGKENVIPIDQDYPTEFLNSLHLSELPPYELKLKIGIPVLLMRNLNVPKLCNGTRLIVQHLGKNIITAIIATGKAKGETVMIPRIPTIPSDLPFHFRRLQFPVKVAFAMTINKAQGQTLKVAGVHLETPCFSHGQLYVAFSRSSSPKNLYVLAKDGETRNVVHKMVLK